MRVTPPALALVLLLASTPALAEHEQSSGAHTTRFDHKTGNEWWVEVLVAGSPSGVEARDDGGPWMALEKKSWGAWAKSFHIEPGHRVQFRARWSDGAAIESCWFTHPAGVEQCGNPPPPPSNTTPVFVHGGGNEWWVEARVSPMPGKVEAMDTGGAWVPLSFRSWGEWANSFRVEPGNDVRFRAYLDGAWHESCWFAHPSGAPRGCATPAPQWPREGSYVRYFEDQGDSWPTGADWHELNVTLRYVKGAWQEEVEGWSYLVLYDDDEGDRWQRERIQYVAPSRGPAYSEPPADADSTSYATKKRGQPIVAPALAWSGENDPECPCGEWSEVAHNGTSLMLSHHMVGRMSHSFTKVTDTDAPIAPGDPLPTPPPPPSWPTNGSYVAYNVHEWSRDDWSPHDLYYNATYRYENGAWTIHCVGTLHQHEGRGQNASSEPFESRGEWGAPSPPLAPTAISNGTRIQFERIGSCHTWRTSPFDATLVARSWVNVTTSKDGAPFKAKAWYADENATQEAMGLDYDAWWDPTTRLVLRWEVLPGDPYGMSMGNMTNTDAPLRRAS